MKTSNLTADKVHFEVYIRQGLHWNKTK